MKNIKWIIRVYKNNIAKALRHSYLTIKTNSKIFSMSNMVCFDNFSLGYPDDSMLLYLIRHGCAVESFDSTKQDKQGVAQIAYSPVEKKWYGWSHRAVYGFGIGYVAENGDSCTTSGYIDEYLVERPELKDEMIPVGFETLDDAKKAAIAFAKSVS